MDELTTADVDGGVAVKVASEKKRKHNERQQALNNMFAKSPKSEGNNTTMAGIMDVQILVSPLPMAQRERINNKPSNESFQKYIRRSKEGGKYASHRDRGNRRS